MSVGGQERWKVEDERRGKGRKSIWRKRMERKREASDGVRIEVEKEREKGETQ